MSDPPLAQILGEAQMKAVHAALKPHLRAAGVRAIEDRIGKRGRFFENVRQRGTLRLRDFLATCAALEVDPVDLVKAALDGEITPEIRPPRIVVAAWKRLGDDGPGLGEERMAALGAAVQAEPRQTRTVLVRELPEASRKELPLLLGLYASAFRVESDLARADLVLRQAREIARTLDSRDAEPDLLIRMAYVALEREQLPLALRWAQESTLASARLRDAEGQGRGFLTIGMLRYYARTYREAICEASAALAHLDDPLQRLASHQLVAFCHAELGEDEESRRQAGQARALAKDAPGWVDGKLSWLEARLGKGADRLDGLQRAQAMFFPIRPADCALVTIELIECALALGDQALAEREAMGLCALVERSPSPQIEKAIVRLFRHQCALTRALVSKIRRSLERGQSMRLAALVSAEPL
ncbi:MAG: hypothetical protein GY719_20625 [bacterium]|nr:hypothetical protein [bacterium]